MAIAMKTGLVETKRSKKRNKMTITSFLAEVKPIKNLDESLAKNNTLYDDPTYKILMASKGYKVNG